MSKKMSKKIITDIKDTKEVKKEDEQEAVKKKKLNLTDKQKLVLAFILTVLIVSFLYFLSLSIKIENNRFVFQMPFANNLNYIEDKSQREEVERAIADLEKKLSQHNQEDLLIEKVRFEDLKIYPIAWVEKHFTPTERRNPLISGPNADPDGDGLINRLEYMYSSDPKNAYSLCGEKTDKKPNCDKNDKQNVENGISPLTGLPIQEIGEIIITRQDRIMAEELNDSMVNASRSGVDFPEVYQLSSTIDLTEELNKIEFTVIPDDRNSLLKYMELRTEFLKDFTDSGAIFSFSEIYKLVDTEALRILKNNYQSLYDDFKNTPTPESQADFQRAVLFSLKKAIELIDVRISTLTGEIEDNDKQVEKNREKSIELVWGFRRLTEILQRER